MKIKYLLFIIVGTLWGLSAFPYVEELNFQEWAGGLPLPDGWTHEGLTKGSADEGKGGVYFNAKDDWLLSPAFSAEIRTVTVEVHTSNTNPVRRLYLHPVAKGVTNEVGIALSPTTNKVYVAQEFSLEGFGADRFVLKCDNGSSGNWWVLRVTVRFGGAETDREDGASPRFWSLSAFVPKPGIRVADFMVLRYARPQTFNSWRNGITVDGFHAFSESGPVANIRVGNLTSYYSGLYVIDAGSDGPGLALGLLGSGGSAMELMLPIALDTASPPERLSVDYRVWELANGGSSILSFSYRTLDDLRTMNMKDAVWTSVSNAVWKTGDEDTVQTVDLPKKDVRGAKFVCLRWSVPKKESSSIIGISDVRVSAEVRPRGLAVLIR